MKIYVASRVKHADMWRNLCASGIPIVSTWIYEANEGETADMGTLWKRIVEEVLSSKKLVLYAERTDFPMKGALVEVGMALAVGIPIICVIKDVPLEQYPHLFGSWTRHPLVSFDSLLLMACGVTND